jgi:sRNA-binding carbon storage regulator CsrA
VILVMLAEIRGNKARIGIQADPSVRIDRFETAQAKRKEGTL